MLSRKILSAVTFLFLFLSVSFLRAEPTANPLPYWERELFQFDSNLSLHDRKVLKETSWQNRHFLNPSLQKKYEEREFLKEKISFWRRTKDLATSLIKLPGNPSEARREEAFWIAKTAVEGFGKLRRRYGMTRPAVMHNFFVNLHLKKEGFCWHWARDLSSLLRQRNLKHHDLLWATAREGTLREHNALVIVSKGQPFERGLILDGWRHSGKPFWIPVEKDHYPWRLSELAQGK